MTREQFLTRIYGLKPNDEAGMASLAHDVVQDARESVRAAVELWQGSDRPLSVKAASLLGLIEDLAIAPLTEGPEPPSVEQSIWLLYTVTTAELGLRGKIVRIINRSLDDRRKASVPKGAGPIEAMPPLPRVCDEGYLQMRRLLNPAESQEQYHANANAFFALPEAQKDAEIRKARASPTWTQLVRTARER